MSSSESCPDNFTEKEAIKRWSKAIGTSVPIRESNQVQYLIDGPNAFLAMYNAILTALSEENGTKNYIYLLGWWLDDNFPLKSNEPGSTIKDIFTKASQKPYKVQIRVMLWDQVGRKNSKEIKNINNLPTGAGILDNEHLYFGSHHQKILIIKNERELIGFCGGIDINKDRINTEKRQPGSPMHDVHCQIKGTAVHDLVDIFVQRWRAHPKHSQLDKEKGALLGLPDRTPPELKPQALGGQSVGIARTFNCVADGKKCAKEHSVRSLMMNAIDTACKFIYIEDQYLINFDAANKLKDALPRISHLTILIPNSEISDVPFISWGRKRFISILQSSPDAAKKVRVFYRYTPGKEKFGKHSYIHAKTWILDDQLAIIGSANCNQRGWSHDSEVIAAILGPSSPPSKNSFAKDLRMDLWAEHLGIERKNFENGIDSADLWLKESKTSAVHRYYLENEKSTEPKGWYSIIDPSAENLPKCQVKDCP